jgi:cyclic pyranopterin phosphate synthase
MEGLAAAKDAGLEIKINAVALKNFTEDEVDEMISWCGDEGFDLTFIETMPMGEIDEDRTDQYLPLSTLAEKIRKKWTLEESSYQTGGPASYSLVKETGKRIGFITPLTHNFCESCNRVRLTCTGQLYMCLGQEDQKDLLSPIRMSEGDDLLMEAIDEAIGRKPKGHDFIIDRQGAAPAVARHMSVTGG